MTTIPDDLSYEEAFRQLEEVLAALESGDLPLEESLARYELGAALALYCEQKLDTAELRVRKWQPNDEPAPLDEWQSE
ncbi:MAG: exodeoxyribonuclease VII small subunit [Caldilineaceae bacterium]|nr:exodeoxyribonuclease VII small subunit [Caldilineaceae bacterium]